MIYLYMLLALLAIWLVNVGVGMLCGKLVGSQNEFYLKTIENSDNIFKTVFGIAAIAFAYYILSFAKWLVLAYYGIIFLVGAAMFMISLVTQLIDTIFLRHRKMRSPVYAITHSAHNILASWCTLLSNLFAVAADAVILLGTFVLLFS